MVVRNTGFVSSSGFSLPEDILRKLRRSSFVSGTSVGPETTRAAIEGALSVGAEKESRQQAISAQLAIETENLERLERQTALDEAFRQKKLGEDEAFRQQDFERRQSEFDRLAEFRSDEFSREEAFKLSEQERLEDAASSARTTALFTGIGQLMFAPIISTSSSGTIGVTSAISKIGSVLKKIFF